MIDLRDYQQDLYSKTQDAFRRGNKRVLVCVGCGAGKSYIFAKMAERARGPVLVLTHRQELKEQTGRLFADNGINARIEMILTEANRLGQHEPPALIITDEAHLSRSNSWMKVLDYGYCLDYSSAIESFEKALSMDIPFSERGLVINTLTMIESY